MIAGPPEESTLFYILVCFAMFLNIAFLITVIFLWNNREEK